MNDLDRQAAELMGWVKGDSYFLYKRPGKIDGVMHIKDWRPSKNIFQALGDGGPGTVVGRLAELGFVVIELRRSCVTGKWSMCWVMNEPGLWRIGPEADTPAAAITEAAIRAVKGDDHAG